MSSAPGASQGQGQGQDQGHSCNGNGYTESGPGAGPGPGPGPGRRVWVEGVQKPHSRLCSESVAKLLKDYVHTHRKELAVAGGQIPTPHATHRTHLSDHLEELLLEGDLSDESAQVEVCAYRLHEEARLHAPEPEREGQGEHEHEHDHDHEEQHVHTRLPCRELHGVWESLVYEDELKEELFRFAEAALEFAERNVSPALVSWSRLLLLHGPPGTGKTALCRGLAQKVGARLVGEGGGGGGGGHRKYRAARLVEIGCQALFSRWFSESGRAVARLFAILERLLEEGDEFVVVLVDEVESLVGCRSAALSGAEPADSLRVVNAVLTRLDRIRRHPNVLVLATSNVIEAIDVAFADRADLKRYVGPPAEPAAYEICRSSLDELRRVGMIEKGAPFLPHRAAAAAVGASREDGDLDSLALLRVAGESVAAGLNGRTLRKIPYLARALFPSSLPTSIEKFAESMIAAIRRRNREDEPFLGRKRSRSRPPVPRQR